HPPLTTHTGALAAGHGYFLPRRLSRSAMASRMSSRKLVFSSMARWRSFACVSSSRAMVVVCIFAPSVVASTRCRRFPAAPCRFREDRGHETRHRPGMELGGDQERIRILLRHRHFIPGKTNREVADDRYDDVQHDAAGPKSPATP